MHSNQKPNLMLNYLTALSTISFENVDIFDFERNEELVDFQTIPDECFLFLFWSVYTILGIEGLLRSLTLRVVFCSKLDVLSTFEWSFFLLILVKTDKKHRKKRKFTEIQLTKKSIFFSLYLI